MLKAHIDAVESHLMAISQIPSNAGHSLHKGTPREAFVREFLEGHLSETVSVGTGEIIDSESVPGAIRNQFDIIIYNKNYPRLDFGGGINGFLAESVVATIEIKSTLTEEGTSNAIRAAKNTKSLIRNTVRVMTSGYVPPNILNYIVAYNGPANMKTVHSWIKSIHEQESIPVPPVGVNDVARIKVSSPSIDGIFVLGKGFVQFNNSPITFNTQEIRENYFKARWLIGNCEKGSLLHFFILLLQATSNTQAAWLNPIPYLSKLDVSGITWGS